MYFVLSNLLLIRWFFFCSFLFWCGKRCDILIVSWICDFGFLILFGVREWFVKVYGFNDFLLFSLISCISDL